jgi:2-oxoglutarate dehydrogenase E2 component (dihydrolipoamide succinyltransferase)
MAIEEVVMPQMGESVAEGTVTTWFKEIGDYIERDEELLEITTDKVDAEVSSPAEGVLVEKIVEPGETVEVGTVIARVDTEAEESDEPDVEALDAVDDGDETEESPSTDDESTSVEAAGADVTVDVDDSSSSSDTTDAPRRDTVLEESVSADADGGEEFPSREELRRTRSTPLVRRIADEHGIDDLTRIEGSGLSGRVTKEDILEYIEADKHLESENEGAERPESTAPETPTTSEQRAEPSGDVRGREPLRRDIERPEIEVGPRDEVEAMGPHRERIAEHMVRSRATSAHAHTVHEVDFSNVVEDREARKEEFAQRDAKLTYTAYIVKAAVEALLEFPIVNATIDADEEHIVYRGDVNVGLAVALEKSLIVPVLERADELSLLGLARRINDLADRARNKQLKTDEVEGGTFTVSNHGVFGPEFGIPIINQPQAAILSTGAIKKRVTVDQETEAIEVRPTSMWCLSFDHRIIDGATADRFMRHMRETIEEW